MLGNFLGAFSIAISFGLAAMTTAWTGEHPNFVLWFWIATAFFFVFGICCLAPPIIHKLKARKSPLEIVFDPGNPARRFWSLESRKHPNKPDEFVPFHEYRIEVRNISSKTVKNVRVIKEHTGALPVRPTYTQSDLTKTEVYDIHPGCSVLVPIVQWPEPIIQAGMLAGSSALEYGPIRVTASGDDVPPAKHAFKFDYQRTPMIYD